MQSFAGLESGKGDVDSLAADQSDVDQLEEGGRAITGISA